MRPPIRRRPRRPSESDAPATDAESEAAADKDEEAKDKEADEQAGAPGTTDWAGADAYDGRKYVIQTGVSNSLVLDVASAAKGGNVLAGAYNSASATQKWYLVPSTTEGYYFIYLDGTDFVLDVKGANGAAGSNVQLWTKNGSDAQLWKVSGTNYITITSKLGESLGLGVKGGATAAGTNVELANIASKAQRFYLVDTKPTVTGTKTIEDVCNFLGLPQDKSIKALLYQVQVTNDDPIRYVAAFIRGDRQVNEIKLVNALNIPEFALTMADEATMGAVTGCVGGFTGPIGLHDCTIVVDSELVNAKNMCAGACEEDHHYINVNYGRDYKADIVKDIKLLQEGDPCPVCGQPVRSARSIEVGQVFKLFDKYSKALGLTYKDENQQDQLVQMGCYGIGVSRTMQAIVEQHHDEHGIIWPMSVAPYHVIIDLVGIKDETQKALAEDLYEKLQKRGVEVILDDRDERPGVKFKDADLIGIPIRIVVGKKAADGIVEYKLRRGGDVEELSADEALEKAVALVNAERYGK